MVLLVKCSKRVVKKRFEKTTEISFKKVCLFNKKATNWWNPKLMKDQNRWRGWNSFCVFGSVRSCFLLPDFSAGRPGRWTLLVAFILTDPVCNSDRWYTQSTDQDHILSTFVYLHPICGGQYREACLDCPEVYPFHLTQDLIGIHVYLYQICVRQYRYLNGPKREERVVNVHWGHCVIYIEASLFPVVKCKREERCVEASRTFRWQLAR